MENFITKAMLGLAIVGESSVQTATLVLTGHYDLELKCAFFFTFMKKSAQTEAELEIPEVLLPLERLKNLYRSDIQAIFDHAAKLDREALLKQLKDSNKPHEMGTVAEIAAKYGISKSEVRRRKTDGTLHELKNPT